MAVYIYIYVVGSVQSGCGSYRASSQQLSWRSERVRSGFLYFAPALSSVAHDGIAMCGMHVYASVVKITCLNGSLGIVVFGKSRGTANPSAIACFAMVSVG